MIKINGNTKSGPSATCELEIYSKPNSLTTYHYSSDIFILDLDSNARYGQMKVSQQLNNDIACNIKPHFNVCQKIILTIDYRLKNGQPLQSLKINITDLGSELSFGPSNKFKLINQIMPNNNVANNYNIAFLF